MATCWQDEQSRRLKTLEEHCTQMRNLLYIMWNKKEMDSDGGWDINITNEEMEEIEGLM